MIDKVRTGGTVARLAVLILGAFGASLGMLGLHATLALASEVSGVSATNSNPSPAAGAPTDYSVAFTTSSSGELSSTAGSFITITLPSGTGLGTLTGSSVTDTTSGQEVGSSCSPSGTTMTCQIVSGTISSGDAVLVELNGVTNPNTPGSETLTVSTSSDTTPAAGTYSVTSAGTPSQPTVNDAQPSPAAGAPTVYTIGFTTSANGGLAGSAGSTITIRFPTGTNLSSVSSSLVTDTTNGQPVGSCESASGTTDTCTISGIVTGGDNLSVELDGVTNPGMAGPQTLKVSTSSDTTQAISTSYSVTAPNAPSQPSVTDSSPSSAAGARTVYTIAFTTSATGGLSAKAGSQITITLPSGTGLGSLSGSSVTDTTSGQQVGSCGTSGVVATCSISGTVPSGDGVSVELDGVVNPTASGAETLKVSTSSDTTQATSASYSVTAASAPAQPTVVNGSPSSAAGAPSVYTITFTTSATGGLSGTAGSTITIHFPSGTGLNSLSSSPVTDQTSGQPVGSCNSASGTTATCSISGPIASGDVVSIELDGVVNPTPAGSQTLKVSTSSDTTQATSASYSVTSPNAPSQPSVTDNSPSSAAGARTVYMIVFTTSATGGLSAKAGSEITVLFPSGTGLGSLSNSLVTDTTSGQQVGSCASTSGTTLLCSISGTVTSGDALDVELDGVLNPGSSGSQTLRVSTSSDTTQASSSTYSVTSATQVTQPSVANNPSGAGVSATYSVTFTTSSSGALSGTAGSQVTIVFPAGSGLGSLSGSSVTDQTSGQQVGSCNVASGTTVTCPISATIASGDTVIVALNGISNPDAVGSDTLKVSTSSDTGQITSSPYSVTSPNSPSQPSVDDATPSSAAGAPTVYTIAFTTSASGALSSSQSSAITIRFPAGTGLSALTNSTVTDTSTEQQVGYCSFASGTTATCTITGTISADDGVSVELDGVVNPSTPGAETLKVSTSSDTTQATSSGYLVTSPGSVAQPSVSNSSPSSAAGARTVYTIAFTTSPTGGLSSKADSQITILFPSGTGLGSLSGSSVTDTTAGQQVASCNSPSGTTVTCAVYGTVAAGDGLSIELDGVTNPSAPAPETLRVSTSSDATPATSAPYGVGSPVVVTGSSSNITPTTASVSATVNPEATAVTDCHFDWGTSTSYGQTAACAQVPGSGDSAVLVSSALAGLTPDTTYHFRIEATNSGGTSVGDDQIFATPAAVSSSSPPSLFPQSPSQVSSVAATFGGQVVPAGLATTAYFEYGLDPKYSGGGSVVYDQFTASQSVGSDFSGYTVTASVSGLVSDAVYHVRLVASNAAGTTVGPDQTFTTLPSAPPPPPTIGVTANMQPVQGLVLVKLPARAHLAHDTLSKGRGFVPLTQNRQLPVGSEVDARRGTLELIVATAKKHRTQMAKLSGGLFTVTQQRSGVLKGLATLTLDEGLFPGAPSYASCSNAKPSGTAPQGEIARKVPRYLQTLSATDDHGSFRTVGHYSAATVRGTSWDTSDRCDGTLTAVHRGSVDVLDFSTRRTVVLHAGESFLARAVTASRGGKPKK
jgi:hypothetical protein